MKTIIQLGRSSSKLQYLKVNKNQMPSASNQNVQIVQEISDSDKSNNQIELFNESMNAKNTSLLSNEDTTSWYPNKEFDTIKKSVSSPAKTPIKTCMSKKNRKFFSKKSVSSTGNEKSNDRDSPTSKKSVDLLLNDENSHENIDSNSSNASSCLNDNASIEIKNDQMDKSKSNDRKGIKSKFNIMFKINKDKTDGKFHKITSSVDLNDDNENPYKQITIVKNEPEIRKSVSNSKTELKANDKTPNLSIKSEMLHNGTKTKNNEAILSQSFNINSSLLNSNNSITGLIDKMNEKLPNYVSLTKLNGNHVDTNTSLITEIKSTNKINESDQSNLSIKNFS